ncbi:hypothetical protein ACFPIJ_52925 [Dactylosporangium cerinum]|uniref:Uncharacterized protein n=1 Tax=Dactylosporangium cerinum TaxID=1434730 RepID=A0ABV9WHJ7_9ACTN
MRRKLQDIADAPGNEATARSGVHRSLPGFAGQVNAAKEPARAFLEEIGLPAPSTDVLSYAEVVGFFRTHLSPTDAGQEGVVLRKRLRSGDLFHLAVVTTDGEPVVDPATGQKISYVPKARSCDPELTELFGDRDMIIFD